jgi:probable F420-dependent oxidoreductase
VQLGTNVAIAFPRSPMVTAQLAWDLQALSSGRFRLGLGTQVKAHIERRYASPWTGAPGPRLREYVQCIQAIFRSFQSGRAERFQGNHYEFTLLPPFFSPGPIEQPRVPIQVAAVNPYMGRLAGELCDGLRLHPIATFRFATEKVLPAVAAGAAQAGRSAQEIDVIGAPFLAIAPNAEGVDAAKQALKQHIAFYASTPTYHAVLEHHGWLDVGRELHRLSREGKWTAMPDLISDAMLEEWAIVGTRDEMVGKLRERCTGVFTTLVLDLEAELRRDEDWLAGVVAELQRGEGT